MSDHFIPITAADIATAAPLAGQLLALNNSHARELSWLEHDRLKHLVATAFFAARIGDADAFMIAFDQHADYDSPNFVWFRDRYPRFIYVDRIVVSAQARGRGHAQSLYTALFEAARNAGHKWVVCEVNSDPPNPNSDAFHAKNGFTAVDTAHIDGGRKSVRYLARRLSSAAGA